MSRLPFDPDKMAQSAEQAKKWYESADYQEVVGKRLQATEGFSVLAQSANFG